MASLNKVMLIGNLGKDPEVRYTAAGTAVASFSLATTDRFKSKSGEWEEKTEWHNITLWTGWLKLPVNTSPREKPFTSRAGCRRENGRTGTARIATPRRSSARKCRCSPARVKVAGAAREAAAGRLLPMTSVGLLMKSRFSTPMTIFPFNRQDSIKCKKAADLSVCGFFCLFICFYRRSQSSTAATQAEPAPRTWAGSIWFFRSGWAAIGAV